MKPIKRTTALVAYATTSSLLFASPAFAAGTQSVAAASPVTTLGPVGIGAAGVAVAAGIVGYSMRARKRRQLEDAYMDFRMQLSFDGSEISNEAEAHIEQAIGKGSTSVEGLKDAFSSISAQKKTTAQRPVAQRPKTTSAKPKPKPAAPAPKATTAQRTAAPAREVASVQKAAAPKHVRAAKPKIPLVTGAHAAPKLQDSRPAHSRTSSRLSGIPQVDRTSAFSMGRQPAHKVVDLDSILPPEPIPERSARVARRSQEILGQQSALAGGAYAPKHASKSGSQVVVCIEPRVKPSQSLIGDLERNFSSLLSKNGKHMRAEDIIANRAVNLSARIPRISASSSLADELHRLSSSSVYGLPFSPAATASDRVADALADMRAREAVDAEIAAAGRAAGLATARAALRSKANMAGIHVGASDTLQDTYLSAGSVTFGASPDDAAAMGYETVHIGAAGSSGKHARLVDSMNTTQGDLLGFRYPADRTPEPFSVAQSSNTTLSGLSAPEQREKVPTLAAIPVI